MRLIHFYKKTEILKYQIAEYNTPFDYMTALWRNSVRPTEQ